MTSFCRAGYVSTCSLQRTFLSSEAPHSSKTLEGGKNLDSEKKTKSNGDTAVAVRLFEVIKKYAKSRDVQTKTELLKSYCDWGLYDQAMKIVRSIVNTKVYETDSYDVVIKSMIGRGQIERALQVFEEKLERQQNFPTRTCVGNKDFGELIELLLNRENLFVKGKNFDGHHHYKTSQMVFRYIQQRGTRLPVRLIRLIHYWLLCDPHKSWTWQHCTISEAGKCSACGHMLIKQSPQEDLHQLQKEIVKLIEIWPKSTFQPTDRNLEYQRTQEIQTLKTFVKAKGPFDVIIDGWNAMNVYSGAETITYTDKLIEVASHFALQKKNVVVVLSETGSLSQKLLRYLNRAIRDLRTVNCHVFVSRFENDDLYLLYAAAMSGLGHVEVVTNDKLRDHRLLFPAEVGWTFSRWARLNCVTFTSEKKEKLQFFRHKVDPVVQYNGNSWHFPVSDETWRCSRRSQRYKSLY